MQKEPFNFDNSYAQLPETFFRRLAPTPVSQPALILFNHRLAAELGMHVEKSDDEIQANLFAGNQLPEGAEPIALAYAGHQFGHFVPQLGDGRALLLGEVIDRSGTRRDIQLKGSGQTPFSRNGDGRAALGPVMREYIVSEAMHALGIRTTRSLAAVTTGESVNRGIPLPGAILTRVAASHVRIGTFEYFAARRDWEAVQQLVDYVINRHYPGANSASNPYLAFLESVMEAQAKLVASWMQVGFIHGVMNTDNMAISGETIDYGPCAFMDEYHPMKTFSSIDQNGRYAFSNQPYIASWNLARLAETLLPLLDDDIDKAITTCEDLLENFIPQFRQYWLTGMRKKIGLVTEEAGDLSLIESLLKLMHENQADYTLTFRSLSDVLDKNNDAKWKSLFADQPSSQEWLGQWQQRLNRQTQSPAEIAESMRRVNPAYIPRNHRIERAIEAAVDNGDFAPMKHLCDVLANPFEERDEYADYMLPPLPEERVSRTFCGT